MLMWLLRRANYHINAQDVDRFLAREDAIAAARKAIGRANVPRIAKFQGVRADIVPDLLVTQDTGILDRGRVQDRPRDRGPFLGPDRGPRQGQDHHRGEEDVVPI